MSKVMKEKQTRAKILEYARRIGAYEDLQNLFNKLDQAIAMAPPSEKDEMAKLAIIEVQKFLDIHAKDGLSVGGETIIDAEEKE